MAETLRISYARLFDVRVLHHFWLDDGATVFDAVTDDAARARRLQSYDARRIVAVTPTRPTRELVAGLRGVFRATGLGCFVALPEDTQVPTDATFEFFLSALDPDFATYTALGLRPREVVDVVEPDGDDGIMHRFQSNVPTVSNATGAARGSGANRRLFLSRPYPGSGDAVEHLFASGGDVAQLAQDPPNPDVHILGPTAQLPVYLHQGDVQAITPPAGSTGAPARGVELFERAPRTLVAVLRLEAGLDPGHALSFTTGGGTARTPTRIFEIHLPNRRTTWQYRDRRDGSVTRTETDVLPLTHFGNAGSRRKASRSAIGVERSGDRVTALVSDIYT